jgi:hypothetical protein
MPVRPLADRYANQPQAQALVQRLHDALDARTDAAIACRETYHLIGHSWGEPLSDAELFQRLRAPRTDELTSRAVLKRLKEADAAYDKADADLHAVLDRAESFLGRSGK